MKALVVKIAAVGESTGIGKSRGCRPRLSALYYDTINWLILPPT
jgi:hypothetical protein